MLSCSGAFATEAPPWLRHGKEHRLPNRRITVDLDDLAHAELGYAITVHKAQGATLGRAFVLAGGWMQDRELANVQMSRAKEECRIFATGEATGEDVEELVKSMERSRQKELAHQVLEEERRRQEELARLQQQRSIACGGGGHGPTPGIFP